MAEQYPTILRRAVARVVGAEARGEVYIKARAALLDQLKATKAPPAEVAHQRVLMEAAIQDVEREAVEAAFMAINRTSAKTPRDMIVGSVKTASANRVGVPVSPAYVPPPLWIPPKTS